MGDMKERILLAALSLFADRGYEAVSVSDVAGALGVTKGALYRHYESKQAILESILRRMEQRDAEQARDHGLPEGTAAETPEAYRSADPEDLLAFSEAMFRCWTEDPFASRFRRMLTLEQYRSPEMGRLYQQYLGTGPLGYTADLLSGMGLSRPREAAAELYGPMLLLYGVYDAAEDKSEVTALAHRLLENACSRVKEEMRSGNGQQ